MSKKSAHLPERMRHLMGRHLSVEASRYDRILESEADNYRPVSPQ